MNSGSITNAERESLLKLCRQRERLAKAAVGVLAAKRRANFEAQLAREFGFDEDRVWKQAYEIVKATVDQANKDIAARSAELGIPREFAPSLRSHWFERGQNASRERRAELTKVAHAEIAHLEKEAKFRVEQSSLEIQTRLLADSLESAAAKLFLEEMPTPEQLMPELTVRDIESKLPKAGSRTTLLN
jgi:hypothetical protein